MPTFSTGYFDDALDDLAGVIKRAKRDLRDVDFDTLVGTGFSGGVVIPALALAMGRKFVLIRKEDDDSHHGGGRLVGNLGARWIFVDDFISGGTTKRRVISKIAAAVVINDRPTQYVGDYLYKHAKVEGWGPAWRPLGHPQNLAEDWFNESSGYLLNNAQEG
jgi:hypothetical protein